MPETLAAYATADTANPALGLAGDPAVAEGTPAARHPARRDAARRPARAGAHPAAAGLDAGRNAPGPRGDGAGGAPAAPPRRGDPRDTAAARRDDRGAGRRAGRRRAGGRSRFLRGRHQRFDPVHAGDRPHRRAGGASLQPAASGGAAPDPVRRRGGGRGGASRSASAARWPATRAIRRCCWGWACANCRCRRATSRGSSSASAASTWSPPPGAPARSWTRPTPPASPPCSTISTPSPGPREGGFRECAAASARTAFGRRRDIAPDGREPARQPAGKPLTSIRPSKGYLSSSLIALHSRRPRALDDIRINVDSRLRASLHARGRCDRTSRQSQNARVHRLQGCRYRSRRLGAARDRDRRDRDAGADGAARRIRRARSRSRARASSAACT